MKELIYLKSILNLSNSEFYVRLVGRKCTAKCTVIYIRIKKTGEKGEIMISTRQKVSISDFNPRKQTVKDNTLNQLIQTQKIKIIQTVYRLCIERENVSLLDVKKVLTSNRKPSILEIAERHFKTKEKAIKPQSLKVIKSQLYTFIRNLNLINQPLTISHNELEKLMLNQKSNYSPASFLLVVTFLKQLYRYAYLNNYIVSTPFDKIDVRALVKSPKKKPKPVIKYNDIKEQLIELHQKQSEKQAQLTQFALFQLQTGLSYIDVKTLDKSDIVEQNNQYFILKNRQKTNVECLIPVNKEIVALYTENFKNVGYTNYNNFLRDNFDITTHKLRHSRAQNLLNRGLKIEAVSRILGHKTTMMTLHYATIKGRDFLRDEIDLIINSN